MGVASVLNVQSFFFIKENWICALTRHDAEANINILLTRNLLINSDVRTIEHVFILILFVDMHGAVVVS